MLLGYINLITTFNERLISNVNMLMDVAN